MPGGFSRTRAELFEVEGALHETFVVLPVARVRVLLRKTTLVPGLFMQLPFARVRVLDPP